MHVAFLLLLLECAGPGRELAVKTLTPERLAAKPEARRSRHFRADTSLAMPGSSNADYSRDAQYVRGHMVPAADVAWSEEALQDSFLLSNTVPQHRDLNLRMWRKLENWVRRQAAAAESVRVITGPIYCDAQPERAGRLPVPCRLFKVAEIHRGGTTSAHAFILPNDCNPEGELADFAVPVEEVARQVNPRTRAPRER